MQRRACHRACAERVPSRSAARRGSDHAVQGILSRFKDTSADRLQAIAHALGRADGDFLAALAELQQACGVDKLRLSDYGVKPEDAGELADNAASTMGALFRVDPRTLSREEIMDIITESI
ncbi:MAG: iron-containing alcohol dehydrogenase [Butyricicoccus sp.]